MTNICYSGGARGADLKWGEIAKNNGHEVIHYSFKGHSKIKSSDIVILEKDELLEADELLCKANDILKRSFPAHSEFVNNLLRRNYHQVINSDAVYAIAGVIGPTVLGGTAWAIEMFKLLNPESDKIYVFDQEDNTWYQWNFINFIKVKDVPNPEGHWTGIGIRELKDNGLIAMEKLFNN